MWVLLSNFYEKIIYPKSVIRYFERYVRVFFLMTVIRKIGLYSVV